jgi:hypothetical protein
VARSEGQIGMCFICIYIRGLTVKFTHRSKSGTYLIAEYHCGRLQSTPLGKLCTDANASFTLQNNFGTGFVEWLSELPSYYISVVKCLLFNISFIFGNMKQSLGARSSE